MHFLHTFPENLFCCAMVQPHIINLPILWNVKKIELIGHESYDRVYHLNTVNSLHSRIKMMLEQFRGVASKYLNRYLALFSVIVSCTKSSINEFVDNLRCVLSTVRVNITYNSSQTIGILAL